MLIKSLLKREGGTEVSLDGEVYHFAPNENDEHVCEVNDEAHIKRLLDITEGFEEVQGGIAKAISTIASAAVNAVKLEDKPEDKPAVVNDDSKKKALTSTSNNSASKPQSSQAQSKPKQGK